MKFRKYSGELRTRTLCCATLCVLLLGFSIYLSVWTGEYQCLLITGFLPILYFVGSTYLFFLRMFREDKSDISDMIVINENGIKLECENGHNISIIWKDIIKIEKKSYIGLSPLIYVTSVSGEVIWWYAPNKKAEHYILEQHSELAKLFTAW